MRLPVLLLERIAPLPPDVRDRVRRDAIRQRLGNEERREQQEEKGGRGGSGAKSKHVGSCWKRRLRMVIRRRASVNRSGKTEDAR